MISFIIVLRYGFFVLLLLLLFLLILQPSSSLLLLLFLFYYYDPAHRRDVIPAELPWAHPIEKRLQLALEDHLLQEPPAGEHHQVPEAAPLLVELNPIWPHVVTLVVREEPRRHILRGNVRGRHVLHQPILDLSIWQVHRTRAHTLAPTAGCHA